MARLNDRPEEFALRLLVALVQPQPVPGALHQAALQCGTREVPDRRDLPGQALVCCCLLGDWALCDPDAPHPRRRR